ncbi:MAG: hypothetical protein U5L00_18440 [Desulfovermiculus sp.]|nr:hypothetical protein [Desulfovermiculus sp.]
MSLQEVSPQKKLHSFGCLAICAAWHNVDYGFELNDFFEQAPKESAVSSGFLTSLVDSLTQEAGSMHENVIDMTTSFTNEEFPYEYEFSYTDKTNFHFEPPQKKARKIRVKLRDTGKGEPNIIIN